MRKLIMAIAVLGAAWFAVSWLRDDTQRDPVDETAAIIDAGIASAGAGTVPAVGLPIPAGSGAPLEPLDEEPGGGADEGSTPPVILSAEARGGGPAGREVERNPHPKRSLEETLQIASAAVAEGNSLEALRELSRTYSRIESPTDRARLRREIDPIVEELYFSKRIVPGISTSIKVERGDTLDGIARRLAKERSLVIAPGLIMRVNGIQDARRIRAGQTLKVLTDPMRIEVSKSTHLMDVYLGEVPVLSYRVGLGKNDCTPEGTFRIVTRQVEPIWFNDGVRVPYGDPRNVLGTRWLGFENTAGFSGYGIHGTWEPESIGKNASEGCVRMLNEEVESLFELVPRGIYVTIRP